MELNSNQIQEIIPHRYPFLLVDRITDFEPGKWAKGIKCVSVNEMQFCGHFPQEHVMPGVLIIEALAQVGAIAILSLEENKGKIAYFGGIKNAKFKRQVKPGDVLTLETTMTRTFGKVGIGTAVAKVGDEIAATAELLRHRLIQSQNRKNSGPQQWFRSFFVMLRGWAGVSRGRAPQRLPAVQEAAAAGDPGHRRSDRGRPH